MTDISELIERLENATGPDAELGARILCAIRGLHLVSVEPRGSALNPAAFAICAAQDGERFEFWANDPTCSLDAALTLLPDQNWDHGVGFLAGHGWWAFTKAPDLTQWESRRREKTAAIALCIAALKARSVNQNR